MRRHLTIALCLVAGCYTPETPDFSPPPSGFEDVPITASVPTCADPYLTTAACVLDGDTFDIGSCGEPAERVRMLGLDAPEIAHEPNPADCYGYEATDALEALVADQEILLSFDQDCQGLYFRTLAYVWLPLSSGLLTEVDSETRPFEGETYVLVNTWMVRQGYSKVFDEEIFGTLRLQDAFDQAQDEAEAYDRGLWGACEG